MPVGFLELLPWGRAAGPRAQVPTAARTRWVSMRPEAGEDEDLFPWVNAGPGGGWVVMETRV